MLHSQLTYAGMLKKLLLGLHCGLAEDISSQLVSERPSNQSRQKTWSFAELRYLLPTGHSFVFEYVLHKPCARRPIER